MLSWHHLDISETSMVRFAGPQGIWGLPILGASFIASTQCWAPLRLINKLKTFKHLSWFLAHLVFYQILPQHSTRGPSIASKLPHTPWNILLSNSCNSWIEFVTRHGLGFHPTEVALTIDALSRIHQAAEVNWVDETLNEMEVGGVAGSGW